MNGIAERRTEPSNVSDGTIGFRQSGPISFSTPRAEATRWKKRYVNGAGPLYSERLTATGQVLGDPALLLLSLLPGRRRRAP